MRRPSRLRRWSSCADGGRSKFVAAYPALEDLARTPKPVHLLVRYTAQTQRRANCRGDHLLMDEDDPEKRIADLESQRAGPEYGVGLPPAQPPPPPPQTPGYLRRRDNKRTLRLWVWVALFMGGLILTSGSGTTMIGVVLVVLSVLLPASWFINFRAKAKKERAGRKLGDVELLTVASSLTERDGPSRRAEYPDYWELTSELQICLDSGDTFRGSYCSGRVADWQVRAWGGLDEVFCVGARLRCSYNPTNPDKVLVFPRAKRGDKGVRYHEFNATGPEHVWFYSAT
jgi:hypothetical protein